MPTMKINGTHLEYMERGQGEPVILVHGTLGDYRSWGLQMDAFAEKYHTISYSRRYHHPNPCNGDETDYSAALHADDLAAFIKELGLESAYVVGNSYGAFTALFLAKNHPDSVRSMVLSEPPALTLLENHPEGQPLKTGFLKEVWEPAAGLMKQGKTKEGVKTFVDSVVEKGAFDGFPQQVKELIMDNACELRAETASPDYWTPITCEDAAKIHTPILLLKGGKSVRMLQLVVEELERCLPNKELITLSDSTHEMPSDDPEAFNRVVMDFLDKQAE